MKRKALLLALAVTAPLAFGGVNGWSAPNPCPGPYDPVEVSTNPAAYDPYDINRNGLVCVASNKNAKPQIEDDREVKK